MTVELQDAIGYTRVSGIGQVNGFGPERQREDILNFASRNGYRIVHIFDEAFTGTEAERPALTDLLEMTMETGPKIVIVESLDRLARDLMIQMQILAKLCVEGITLFAANTGENITSAIQEDPMRRAMIQMQGIFAELDKNLTIRKLRRGRLAKKAASGRCEGQKPFGSLPGEERTLRAIGVLWRRHQCDKNPYTTIARKLNEMGYTRRPGKRNGVERPGLPFNGPRVREIILNILNKQPENVV